MGLRDVESKLPPGFRFHPSDEELVCHYLCGKIRKERSWEGTLVEIDLHTCEPWELPDVAKLCANEWYFFSFRDRKYSTGSRTNRATITGYWKATGKDRTVHDPTKNLIVGMRKTLVFYHGRAPNGIKTGWVMHEFRLETPHMLPKEDWVLCRVFSKRSDQQPEINSTTTTTTSSSSPSSSSLFCQQTVRTVPTTAYQNHHLPPLNGEHLPSAVLQEEENSSFMNLTRLQYCDGDFLEDAEYITGFSNGEDDHGLLFGEYYGCVTTDHDNIGWGEINLVEDMNSC